jgi:hypothetical protein
MTIPQGFSPQQFGQQGAPGQGMPGQPVGIPGLPGSQPGYPSVTGGRGGFTPPASTNTGGSFVGGGGSLVGTGYSLGSQPTNQQPGYPGQPLPGQPGAPVNSQQGGMSPTYPTAQGSNGTAPVGFPQPGTTAGNGNAAADMIRNILTTPRPGGMPQGVAGAQTIGGGIAGVASTGEGEGVKVYNDHTLYQEWEFIFDPQKQKQIPNPNQVGAGGTPADRMNNPNPQTQGPGVGPQMQGPGMGQQPGRPPGQ